MGDDPHVFLICPKIVFSVARHPIAVYLSDVRRRGATPVLVAAMDRGALKIGQQYYRGIVFR
jgi:hypothetical protein